MKLFDYQELGVQFLLSPLRCLYLADAPGLGKTIQSLTAAQRLGVKSALVLCPAAIKDQWAEHLRGSSIGRYTVMSYESLSLSPPRPLPDPEDPFALPPEKPSVRKQKLKAQAMRKRLREAGPYDLLILDEAHFLKERGANRTDYILHPQRGFISVSRKVFLLSGTPVLNRPAELYPVLRACYPEALHDCPNFQTYAYKFCDAQPGYNDSLDTSGACNLDELSRRLAPFMLARTKAILGGRLPPLEVIDHDLTIEQEIDPTTHIATRRRETGEAKIDLLIDDIERVADQAGRLVVFYHHKTVRAALARRFPFAPLIHGGMSSSQKRQAVKRFGQLNQSKVMVVQLTAGGVGLDGLQHCAHTGYLAELDWTPALLDQAIGRLHRLGQTQPVTIYRPIGQKQGLDAHIKRSLEKKGDVIASILSPLTQDVIPQSANVIDTLEEILTVFTPEQADALIQQLARIADALEAGQPAPLETAPKRGRKAKATEEPAEPEAPPAPAVEVPTLTHADVKTRLVAEINADPVLIERRLQAFQAFLQSAYGASKLEQVPVTALDAFQNAALTIIAEVQAPAVVESI